MSPKVSFVVTCFNQRKYIAETIEAILGQTIADIELIIVDDGSYDGTGLVVHSYSDRRIRYFWQVNQGPSAATNFGIGQARAPYIALVGGDDICAADRAEVQLDAMRQKDVDILFTVPRLMGDAGLTIDDSVMPIFFGWGFKDEYELLNILFWSGNRLCGPSAFARRDFFDRFGLYRVGLIQLQDFELWIRALRSGARFSLISERTVFYRIRGDGNLSSRRNDSRMSFELFQVYRTALQGVEVSDLRRIFPREINYVSSSVDLEVAIDIALLYLSHTNRAVRAAGVERMIDLLDDPASKSALAARGFQPSHLFELASTINVFQ